MDSMTLKLGQVQLMVGRDKAENLRRACVLIRRAAEQGAQLVMLPEMFCCPYENEMFRPNSEEQGGPAQQALSALSRELGIWIVGGTIPEREGGKLYNTCYGGPAPEDTPLRRQRGGGTVLHGVRHLRPRKRHHPAGYPVGQGWAVRVL